MVQLRWGFFVSTILDMTLLNGKLTKINWTGIIEVGCQKLILNEGCCIDSSISHDLKSLKSLALST